MSNPRIVKTTNKRAVIANSIDMLANLVRYLVIKLEPIEALQDCEQSPERHY